MLKRYSSVWYPVWYPGQLLEHDMTNVGKTKEVFFHEKNFPLPKTRMKCNLYSPLVPALWNYKHFVGFFPPKLLLWWKNIFLNIFQHFGRVLSKISLYQRITRILNFFLTCQLRKSMKFKHVWSRVFSISNGRKPEYLHATHDVGETH